MVMKWSHKSLIVSFVTVGCVLFGILPTVSQQFSFQAGELSAHLPIREQQLQPLTVCEALKDRKLHSGKMIAIVGRWSATDEGVWLECECDSELKTGGHVWSNSIWLELDLSSASAFAGKMPVNLVAAKREIEKAKKRKKPLDDKAMWGIVYGRFETPDELQTTVARDGVSVYGVGFGHLNEAPAQLVYKAKDVLLLQDK